MQGSSQTGSTFRIFMYSSAMRSHVTYDSTTPVSWLRTDLSPGEVDATSPPGDSGFQCWQGTPSTHRELHSEHWGTPSIVVTVLL